MGETHPQLNFPCHSIGLDYVSCSPLRVPIARLAAAQAAINIKKIDDTRGEKYRLKLQLTDLERIGRLAFRQVFEDPDMEVTAINDLTAPKMLAHLFKIRFRAGKICRHTVEWDEKSITVDGKRIQSTLRRTLTAFLGESLV